MDDDETKISLEHHHTMHSLLKVQCEVQPYDLRYSYTYYRADLFGWVSCDEWGGGGRPARISKKVEKVIVPIVFSDFKRQSKITCGIPF